MTIAELQNKSIQELENLFIEFPYSSVIATVLAKKAHDQTHINYRKYLSQASLRSPNRIILKEYITNTEIQNIQPETTPSTVYDHYEAKKVVSNLHPVDTSPIKQANEIDEGEIVLNNPLTPKPKITEEVVKNEVVVIGADTYVDIELPNDLLNEDWEVAIVNDPSLSHSEAKEIVSKLRNIDTSPLKNSIEIDEGEIVIDNPFTPKPKTTEDLEDEELVVVGKDEYVEVEYKESSEKKLINTATETKEIKDDEPVSFTGFGRASAFASQQQDLEDFKFVQPTEEVFGQTSKEDVDNLEFLEATQDEPKQAIEDKPIEQQEQVIESVNDQKDIIESDIEVEIYEIESRSVESITNESENSSLYKTIVNLLKEDSDIENNQLINSQVLDADEHVEATQVNFERQVDDELENLYAQASYEMRMEKELLEIETTEQNVVDKKESLPKSSDFDLEDIQDNTLQNDDVELVSETSFDKEEISKIEIERIPEEIGDSTQTNSFTGWLNQLSSIGTAFSEDQKEHQRKLEDKPVPQREIPQIVPEKPDFPESEVKRLAKKSLEPSKAFFTETLGYVYELQEKWSKAVEVYEYLSLINPQKSGYFANRIELLKEKLK